MDDEAKGSQPMPERPSGAVGTTEHNVKILTEVAQMAALGQKEQTAHLLAVEALLVGILRSIPIDLERVRGTIGAMPADLRPTAFAVLDSLEQASRG